VNEHQQEISRNNFEGYVSEGVKCSLPIIHPVSFFTQHTGTIYI